MTAVRTTLWCAVLLYFGAWRVRAVGAERNWRDQPHYRALEIRGNTTAAGATQSSAALLPESQDAPIIVSRTQSTTRAEQETSQSRQQTVSTPAIASDTSIASTTITRIASNSTAQHTTPRKTTTATFATEGDDSSAADGRGNESRLVEDTFIASITTLTRPPLTAPLIPTSQVSSPGLASPLSNPDTTGLITTTTESPYANDSLPVTPAYSTARLRPITTETPYWTSTEDDCTTTSFGPYATMISYSVIHTWTITWIGDPADYTPPFPTISTPNICPPTTEPAGKFTVSLCDGSEEKCTRVHETSTEPPEWPDMTLSNWFFTETEDMRTRVTTITFVTTDKNPAVVYPTSRPPDYGGSPDPAGIVHSIPLSDPRSVNIPDYGNSDPDFQGVKTVPVTEPPIPPITVIVKPSGVVINNHTFTDDPAHPTSTVVVDSSTFVIKPTEVDGAGAKVTRPPSDGPSVTRLPTRTTIGGISVGIDGSSVTMDSTTFTVGTKPTAVVVSGQTVTLAPDGIIFPTQTLPLGSEDDTTRVVVGAELITAVGSRRVVIRGTTMTYASGASIITSVVDGDTVLLGPSGVIVNGRTYGGTEAASTDSEYIVVGGATISQIGPTAVVIEGVTYTFSPLQAGQPETTTVVGGETVTIGPDGVSVSSWTLASPYASTTIITPTGGGGGGSGSNAQPTPTVHAPPIATDTNKKNGDPFAVSRGPGWPLTIWIGMGAGILGCLLAL